jgi:predicted metal-dependent TIM-barrel fold hydrolase
LRGLLSGTITENVALERVQQARSQVESILGLLDRISPTNPNRSLAHRVANALTLPPGVERGALHEELETAMKALESLLQKEFRV